MNRPEQPIGHCPNPRCVCQKHFVTVKEAAHLIRRSERTIYRWLEGGDLPARKIKDGWLIEPTDLFSLLE